MTREAFENAMVVLTTLGGSTNAVLHLIAMARAADVSLTIDAFQRISDRTPLLADMKPSGIYVQEDLDAVGGIPALMKYLLEDGRLHGDCLTVTGKTVAENLKDTPCPKGPWVRSRAKKGSLSPGRPGSLTRRKKCSMPWKTIRSKKGTL
jgi:dihydroxy-acid dehydratase